MPGIDVWLGVKNAGVKSGLNEAKAQIRGFKGEIAGMITGLFAGAGVSELVKDFARVKDLADQFGTSAEAIQRVRGAAEQAGTDVESLARVMAKLKAGGDESAAALRRMGIDAAAFRAQEFDQQLLTIAAALDRIPNESDRVTEAYELLGAKGREVIPMLLQGHEALQQEFEGTAVASADLVAQLARTDDILARSGNQIKVFAAEVLGASADIVRGVGTNIGASMAFLEQLPNGLDAAKAALSEARRLFIEEEQAMMEEADKKAESSASKARALLASREDGGRSGAGKKRGRSPAEIFKDVEQTMEREQDARQASQERADRARAEREERIVGLKQRLHEQELARMTKEERTAALMKDLQELAARNVKNEEQALELRIEANELAERLAAETASAAAGMSADSVRRIGGSLAGVNYGALRNDEAGRQTELQKQMVNILQQINQKQWTVSVPEAK